MKLKCALRFLCAYTTALQISAGGWVCVLLYSDYFCDAYSLPAVTRVFKSTNVPQILESIFTCSVATLKNEWSMKTTCPAMQSYYHSQLTTGCGPLQMVHMFVFFVAAQQIGNSLGHGCCILNPENLIDATPQIGQVYQFLCKVGYTICTHSMK